VGRTIVWSVFVLVAPCSVGPVRVSAEDFRSVGASHGASPLQLSLLVRISHERGDFCRRVAVDFVRKTVYLRQARNPSLVRILHCHGRRHSNASISSLYSNFLSHHSRNPPRFVAVSPLPVVRSTARWRNSEEAAEDMIQIVRTCLK
jgi:hypothetical protein